jgi:hypothetical protein
MNGNKEKIILNIEEKYQDSFPKKIISCRIKSYVIITSIFKQKVNEETDQIQIILALDEIYPFISTLKIPN